MAVDVKVIGVYMWKFFVLFAGICFSFAQKHPCVSGTSLSLLVLYVLFPLVFKLLIYSSPVMVWVYASRKNVIKSEYLEAQIKKQDDQVNDVNNKWVKVDGNVLAKKRYMNFPLQNGREGSADDVPGLQQKACYQQKDMNKDLQESESDRIGKARNDLKNADFFLKNNEVAETWINNITEADWKSEFDMYKKAEYAQETEIQEKDAIGDKQRPVECTKQDDKSAMDLGTSETERGRRLDSLIQKRRARKLLSMQVRNVIDIMRQPHNQMAPFMIARSTGPLNLINTLSDNDDLHMPGSAPSILLPNRSPFDLPYDPFEERPNLAGDISFQQEFINGDQKDAILGGLLVHRQDGNTVNAFMNKEKKGMARHGFSRFRSYRERGSYESLSPRASSGDYELMSRDDITVHGSRYEEQPLNQAIKSDNMSLENHSEPENIKSSANFEEEKVKCDTELLNTEGCEEESQTRGIVQNYSNNQVEGAKAGSTRNTSSEDLTNYFQKSLTSSLQEIAAKENGHDQSPEFISSKDPFNVHKRVLHTPAHSIASDLVVEVSEAGSPPPTLSPSDGDSSQYNGDVDRDVSSGSEDISVQVYRTENINARCLEENESGTGVLALEESIPEPVELEHDVLDGYEHTSQTSFDNDSSYESVVLHEKLKSRSGGYAEFCGPPLAKTKAVSFEKFNVRESNFNSGTMDSSEVDGNSGQPDHVSVEESLVCFHEHSSSNAELPEVLLEGAEARSSGDVDMGLSEVLLEGNDTRSSCDVAVELPEIWQRGTEMRYSNNAGVEVEPPEVVQEGTELRLENLR